MRSYLWLLRKLACGDLTESDEIAKDSICVFPGLVLRMWRKSGDGAG